MRNYIILFSIFLIILTGCGTSNDRESIQNSIEDLTSVGLDKNNEPLNVNDEENIQQLMETFFDYFYSSNIEGISQLIYEYEMPHIHEQTVKNIEFNIFSNQAKFIDFMIVHTDSYGRNAKRINVAIKAEHNNQETTVLEQYSLVKIEDEWKITTSEGIKRESPNSVFEANDFKLEIEEIYYSINTMDITIRLTNLSDHIITFTNKRRGGFKNSPSYIDDNNIQFRVYRELMSSTTAAGGATEIVKLNTNMIIEGDEHLSNFEKNQSIVFKIPVKRLKGSVMESNEYESLKYIQFLYVNQNDESSVINDTTEVQMINPNGDPMHIVQFDELNIEI